MAEFDFSMDPEELNRKVEKEQSKLSKGVDNLKKYEKTLSEQERIILEIAKRRQRIARESAITRGGAIADMEAANKPRPSPFQAGWNEHLSQMGHDFGHGTGVPTEWPAQEQPTLPRDRSRGDRGRSPFEREAGYGGGGQMNAIITGMAKMLPAVTMFAAAVHTFGNMSIQAQQTRAENYQQVGDTKSRAQRAARTLGLSEGDVMNTVTTAADPEAALRAHEQWAAKKRRTGIGPNAQAMGSLVTGAQSGAFSWQEAGQSGVEGTWGRYARAPGLTGEARDYNQIQRGKNAADYDAASITWQTDMDEAKDAVFSEAAWKGFQATHPWASKIPFARASRELRNRFDQETLRDSLSDLPTGAGYTGAPAPAPQAPVQQLGVDVRSGGRGVPTVIIQNPEAIRPRPQQDVRSGNNTAKEN